MKSEDRHHDLDSRDEESPEERRERLLGDYIDRLNTGDTIDLHQIAKDHTDFGLELIEQIEAYGVSARDRHVVPAPFVPGSRT